MEKPGVEVAGALRDGGCVDKAVPAVEDEVKGAEDEDVAPAVAAWVEVVKLATIKSVACVGKVVVDIEVDWRASTEGEAVLEGGVAVEGKWCWRLRRAESSWLNYLTTGGSRADWLKKMSPTPE